MPFVAFRDEEGAAHVLADTCVHRGGSLSLPAGLRAAMLSARITAGNSAATASATKIPSLINQKRPARAKVDSYPTQERYGIVFAFLGDLPEEERPPIYDIEEYGSEEWKAQLYVIDLNAYYERSMENGMDPIHNEFVHPKQGAPMMSAEQQASPVPMEEIPWGSKFYLPFGEKRDSNTSVE